MEHKGCRGTFEQWIIREHHYCFLRCSFCRAYFGGERVKKEVARLMRTKVYPSQRRT